MASGRSDIVGVDDDWGRRSSGCAAGLGDKMKAGISCCVPAENTNFGWWMCKLFHISLLKTWHARRCC